MEDADEDGKISAEDADVRDDAEMVGSLTCGGMEIQGLIVMVDGARSGL
jgi:hypothetical protein